MSNRWCGSIPRSNSAILPATNTPPPNTDRFNNWYLDGIPWAIVAADQRYGAGCPSVMMTCSGPSSAIRRASSTRSSLDPTAIAASSSKRIPTASVRRYRASNSPIHTAAGRLLLGTSELRTAHSLAPGPRSFRKTATNLAWFQS